MSKTTICRISNVSEIISFLEQNSSVVESEKYILIGSQAALLLLPNIRDNRISTSRDYDIICS